VTDFSRRPRRFLPLFRYVHLASLCGQSGITLRIISGDFSAGLFAAGLKTLDCTPDTRHRSHVSANHDIPPRLRHPANYVDWEICATRYRASSAFEGFLNTNNNPWLSITFSFQTYDLYLRITRSPLAAKQRTLKTEILNTKSELLKTSAQDQFAKWAKLRRSVDKGLADLEKLSELGDTFRLFPSNLNVLDAQVASQKSSFAMKFKGFLWIMTTGLQFVVGWWYRKQPVFYLPEGWFGPLRWWLALPFAPAGEF